VRRFLFLAGLAVGALVWAANTQFGEMLPYPQCRTPIAWLALSSFVLGLISIGAALLSWRRGALTDRVIDVFLSRLGLMAGLSFAFAIALQGAASLVLTGCER
jgi:hypothetical protein